MRSSPAAGSPVVASTALQGHARQDLNDKLDDLAPGTVQSCLFGDIMQHLLW